MSRFGRAVALVLPCLLACDAGIEPGGPPAVAVAILGELRGPVATNVEFAMRLATAQGAPLAFEPVEIRLPPLGANASGFCVVSSNRIRRDTADADGVVRFCYTRSGRAGSDSVVLHVPDRLFTDTLLVPVEPGEPEGIGIFPGDTSLAEGGALDLLVSVADQYGNVMPASPVLVARGSVTLSGRRVQAVSFGTGEIEATLGGLRASVRIGVVPAARLVALQRAGSSPTESEVVALALDGSGRQVLSATRAAAAWSGTSLSVPGDEVYFSAPMADAGGATVSRLVRQRIGSTAPAQRVTSRTGAGNELWPRVAPQSGDVFLTVEGVAPSSMHVVTAGGNATPFGPANAMGFGSSDPSPAPDGRRVAFLFGNDGLRVLDRTSGAMASWNVPGAIFPAWSRDGAEIAFVRDGRIGLVRPDGTGLRELTAPGGDIPAYHGPLAWSPDGRYLLATALLRGTLVVVRLADNVAVPLGPWSTRVGSATWRP